MTLLFFSRDCNREKCLRKEEGIKLILYIKRLEPCIPYEVETNDTKRQYSLIENYGSKLAGTAHFVVRPFYERDLYSNQTIQWEISLKPCNHY